MIGEHRIDLHRNGSAHELRVLVDGDTVPMTLTQVETYDGNLGSRTREVAASRPVEWIPYEGSVSGEEPSVDAAPPEGRPKARLRFEFPTGEIYNTAVWQSASLEFTFAGDYSSVDARWHHHIDVAT